MYVCLCHGITDRHIREAISEGCCNYKEVRKTLGVGTQCGKCACVAKSVVRETLDKVQLANVQVQAATFTPSFASA